MRARRRATWVLAAAALLASGLPSADLAAQDPDLDRVEALMSEGRFASARQLLQGWLDENGRTAEREARQRGTWLRALLTVDAEMAQVDLRRLVVRYPGGAYSDRALLRLAQGARARSEPVRALEYLEALLRDYPESPLRERAEAVAAEVEASLSPGDGAPANP